MAAKKEMVASPARRLRATFSTAYGFMQRLNPIKNALIFLTS